MSATVAPVNVCSVRALVVSTTGGSPVTVIASATAPTFRSWSTSRDERAGEHDAFTP